jgi:hypothetical protein
MNLKKRCSKLPCNILFAIHLYACQNDSWIFAPHSEPILSKVIVEGGRNFNSFWDFSKPFGIREIIKTNKLMIKIINENDLKRKKGHITSFK